VFRDLSGVFTLLGSHHVRTGTVAALAASLLLLGSPPAHADGPTGVMLVAHRGAVDHAPESTLAALDQAVADRSDRVSIDVHLTRDGVPVVIHDGDLRRTTNAEQVFPGRSPWTVSDFSLAELKSLDAGSWYGAGGYTGSRVLTLDEVLTELAASPVTLMVEAKTPSLHGGVPGIGAAVKSVLDAHPEWSGTTTAGTPRVVLESFEWDFLDGMHQTYPELPLALLGNVTPDDLATRSWAAEVDVRHTALTPDTVAAAHQAGVPVGTWTPNATADLQRVLDLGADRVTTDQTDRLRTMLRAQGRTWTGTTWPAVPATAAVDVSAPSSAPVGGRVLVTARPRAATGAPLPWQSVTFQARNAGVWRTVGANATDSHGSAALSLPVGETMRVRAVSGGRTSSQRAVAAVIPPVVLPAGAPRPSVRLAAQAAPATNGADPRVGRVPAGIWRSMTGRSWRAGCPVGRAGLRTLQVSYWGFDGRRHRGTLVVATRSAAQLARVFTRLYAQRLPVRSLRRLETLGGWSTAVPRAMRADAGFGFACQRVPGDRTRRGTHAYGTRVTIDPWENPTKAGRRGTPDTWWLSRSRTLSYVHAASSPVVRAFAAEGFAWNGRYGRYADFRDVRR
jgi:glycerophosphoryl diester phosphodiesterase